MARVVPGRVERCQRTKGPGASNRGPLNYDWRWFTAVNAVVGVRAKQTFARCEFSAMPNNNGNRGTWVVAGRTVWRSVEIRWHIFGGEMRWKIWCERSDVGKIGIFLPFFVALPELLIRSTFSVYYLYVAFGKNWKKYYLMFKEKADIDRNVIE